VVDSGQVSPAEIAKAQGAVEAARGSMFKAKSSGKEK
jgi:hypothetical protein